MKKLTRPTTADRISAYVVKGVFAESGELAMERVALLLQKDNLLDLFANGVPVAAEIADMEGLLEHCKKNDRDVVEVTGVYIDQNSFDFYMKIREISGTRYWRSLEEANEYSKSGNSYGRDCKDRPDETYCFKGQYITTRSRHFDGVDEFLDIEYV